MKHKKQTWYNDSFILANKTAIRFWQFEYRMIDFIALLRWARIYKSPATGKIAEMIWRLFSSETFTSKFSKQMYINLGYEPFEGYPLKRRITNK